MPFPEKLTSLQEERKVSNYRIAKELRISPTTLTNWKTGATKPSRAYVHLLAEYFGVGEETLTEPEGTA